MAGAELLVPRGPQVDISLFPQAAAAGTNIGNAQKTIGQGIAEGVIGGIQGYEAVRQSEADIAYKEAQVEQMPIEMEIRRQQLENEKAITEINQLKMQRDLATQKEQLEIERARTTQELSVFKGKDILNQKLGDAIFDKSTLNDPNVIAALNSDEKYRNGIAGVLFQKRNPDGSPVLSEEEKDDWMSRIDAENKYKFDQERKLAEEKLHSKITGNLDAVAEKMKEGKLAYLGSTYHLKPEDWSTNVMMAPAGVKTYDFKTGELQNVPDKKQQPGITDYDVFIKQNGKWTKALVNVKDTEADDWAKFKGAYRKTFGEVPEAEFPTPGAPAAPKPEAPGFFSQAGQMLSGAAKEFFTRPSPEQAVAKRAVGNIPNVSQFASSIAVGTGPSGQAALLPGGPAPSEKESFTQTYGGKYIGSQGLNTPPITSTNPVVAQAQALLEQRAANEPELAKRLLIKRSMSNFKDNLTINPAFPESVTVPAKPQASQVPAEEPKAAPNLEKLAANTPPKDWNDLKGWMNQKVSEVMPILTPAAKKQVDPKILSSVLSEPLLQNQDSLVKAVAAVESAGNRGAKSKKGPVGLFQLTKDAATDMKVNRNNPEDNVKGGVAYLEMLKNRFHGNTVAALMAYNVGMGVVDDAIDIAGGSDWESILSGIKMLMDRGSNYRHHNILNSDKLKEVGEYPAKVLAYKEAIDSMQYA